MAEPLSLGYVGRALLRFWFIVVLCTFLGGTLAFAASYLITPVYTATATQLVKGLPGKGLAANYEAAQYAVNRAKSYPSFVYSSQVLEGVRSDMNDVQSIDDLRKDLSATNPIDTPLVRITAVGSTPREARDKANSAARHMARFIAQIETVNGTSPIGVETPVAAPLPTDTTSPQRVLMAAVGAALGFGLATILALVRAARAPLDPRSVEPHWWSEDSEDGEEAEVRDLADADHTLEFGEQPAPPSVNPSGPGTSNGSHLLSTNGDTPLPAPDAPTPAR